MTSEKETSSFFAQYDDQVHSLAMEARKVILKALPGIGEEIDVPARMLAYTYGRKYAEAVCTLIPSKKGLKLGFNRAVELPDPDKILEGSGKLHRYVVISSIELIHSEKLKNMLAAGHAACLERMQQMK